MHSECLPCCQSSTSWENEMNAWKNKYYELKSKNDVLQMKVEALEEVNLSLKIAVEALALNRK